MGVAADDLHQDHLKTKNGVEPKPHAIGKIVSELTLGTCNSDIVINARHCDRLAEKSGDTY